MKELDLSLGVGIPVFIQSGEQERRLLDVLNSLEKQTRLPDVVVISLEKHSSHSQALLGYKSSLNVRYTENPLQPGIANNSNAALDKIETDLVHVLHQDDCLSIETLYEECIELFKTSDRHWVFLKNDQPENFVEKDIFDKSTLLGFNTAGGPSAVIMKNNQIRFNANYSMLVDVVFFQLLNDYLGKPLVFHGKSLDYGDAPLRESRTLKEYDVIAELQKIIHEFEVDENRILHALRYSGNNLYQRLLLLKACRNVSMISKWRGYQILFVLNFERTLKKIRWTK